MVKTKTTAQRGRGVRAPMAARKPTNSEPEGEDIFEVESILDKRENSKGTEYYVKWRGYPTSANTWEPSANIMASDMIKKYEARIAKLNDSKLNNSRRQSGTPKRSREEVESELEDNNADVQDPVMSPITPTRKTRVNETRLISTPMPNPKRPVVANKTPIRGNLKFSPEPGPEARPKSAKKISRRTSMGRVPVKAQPLKTKSNARTRARPAKDQKTIETGNEIDKESDAPAEEVSKNKGRGRPKKASMKARGESKQSKKSTEKRTPSKINNSTAKQAIIEEELGHGLDSGQPLQFQNLKVRKMINESITNKTITFLATYENKDAVLRLEVSPFDESVTKKALVSSDLISKLDFNNDIYSNYMLQSSAVLNDIKATVVYPANDKVLAKYSHDETVLFSESPETYARVVEPFIKKMLKDDPDQNKWLHNILAGQSEADRVVYDDPDPKTGFMLVPDLKCTSDEKDVHVVAIVRRTDLRSLRDLNDKHLDLLKNILTKGTEAMLIKYKNAKGKLRTYIHYHPSFYHFHVHFRLVDPSDYISTDRDNLLSTVISNITIKKDYYKKATLTYPLSQSKALFTELKKSNCLA